jgi:hypothetical protein
LSQSSTLSNHPRFSSTFPSAIVILYSYVSIIISLRTIVFDLFEHNAIFYWY